MNNQTTQHALGYRSRGAEAGGSTDFVDVTEDKTDEPRLATRAARAVRAVSD